jgi:hypothetical protein
MSKAECEEGAGPIVLSNRGTSANTQQVKVKDNDYWNVQNQRIILNSIYNQEERMPRIDELFSLDKYERRDIDDPEETQFVTKDFTLADRKALRAIKKSTWNNDTFDQKKYFKENDLNPDWTSSLIVNDHRGEPIDLAGISTLEALNEHYGQLLEISYSNKGELFFEGPREIGEFAVKHILQSLKEVKQRTDFPVGANGIVSGRTKRSSFSKQLKASGFLKKSKTFQLINII